MGNDKGRRRAFGAVRKLPSGRFQVRYPHPETGLMIPAERTFPTQRAAEDHLAELRTDIRREEWQDPEAGKVRFAAYADAWVTQHPKLAVSTRDLYEVLLRLHIGPTFGKRELREIKGPHVRAWRQSLLDKGTGPVTVAKSYRLLRAVLNTAVDDGVIRRNPCRIKGAGTERSPERPVLTVDEVFRVVAAIEPRYRAMVLMATFLGLRFGELVALRRSAIDLDTLRVHVARAAGQDNRGRMYEKDPKSEAGRRWISIPDAILPEVRHHLDTFAPADPDDPGTDVVLFLGPLGGALRRNNFNRIWKRALSKAGVQNVHFHDLRHTGNTMAAATGASLRELMARMGHSSIRAALHYQHATSERDREIADGLSARIRAARQQASVPTAETESAYRPDSRSDPETEDRPA